MAGFGDTLNNAVSKAQNLYQESEEQEEELHQVAQEVQEVIEQEKNEIKVNEELLGEIEDIMGDYESIEHNLQPLMQKLKTVDSSNEAAELSVFFEWYNNHGRNITEDVKELKQGLQELLQDEEREHELTVEVENEEGRVEQQIQQIMGGYQRNVEQADEAINEAEQILQDRS
jgi:DNA repair exonuclease SbcCD ATPase subunit